MTLLYRTLPCTLFLLVLVSACHSAPPPPPESATLVQWDRSPQAITFRAEIAGGKSEFNDRSAVPGCTIYGDNRVVWVNELGPFQIEVLEDRLSDAAIDSFVRYLAVDERIYTFDARLNELQTQTSANPVVERVTLNVNDISHTGDSFSGWGADWFPRVLKACKSLSSAPVLVAPGSGWLWAQNVPFDMALPVATWDAQAMGLSLASVADGAPHWVTGAAASSLWTTLHSLPDNLIFEDGDQYYVAALQVPGVTRDAPPPPS